MEQTNEEIAREFKQKLDSLEPLDFIIYPIFFVVCMVIPPIELALILVAVTGISPLILTCFLFLPLMVVIAKYTHADMILT